MKSSIQKSSMLKSILDLIFLNNWMKSVQWRIDSFLMAATMLNVGFGFTFNQLIRSWFLRCTASTTATKILIRHRARSIRSLKDDEALTPTSVAMTTLSIEELEISNDASPVFAYTFLFNSILDFLVVGSAIIVLTGSFICSTAFSEEVILSCSPETYYFVVASKSL